jgi:methylenetetrahydrofolate--tRNA-(uracil-5-)-methyltransferase
MCSCKANQMNEANQKRGPAQVVVVGAGLAGSEAAWQAAELGAEVVLYEMRPARQTPAHRSGHCAELVCSNSLGSQIPDRATGVLMGEMRALGSMVLREAERHAVPAGGALAVDREAFAAAVTEVLENHPRISLVREEVTTIPEGEGVVLASGPLTSPPLAENLAAFTGQDHLYFYDALSPIVEHDSIDFEIAFAASRYDRDSGDGETGDYVNCPMDREEYEDFVEAVTGAERIPLKDFEKEEDCYFEGCLPIEVMASRGKETLAFGPMRPVGLIDPRSGKRPHAVVQLRRDNAAGSLYNLVGFQTNIKWGEQERILRLIPGLGGARFVRFGQMHRNTFVNAPVLLNRQLQCHKRPGLFLAGQMIGMEGYLGNIASGWLAGQNACRHLTGQKLLTLPETTMLGALCRYITEAESGHFQPMKANFGLMPPLEGKVRGKRKRMEAHAARARGALEDWLAEGRVELPTKGL